MSPCRCLSFLHSHTCADVGSGGSGRAPRPGELTRKPVPGDSDYSNDEYFMGGKVTATALPRWVLLIDGV
eukprot:1235354-Rhodomonas_salina.2